MPDTRTCGDLAAYFAAQPPGRPVVMATGGEDGGCTPVAAASEAMYLAEDAWSGAVYPTPERLAAYVAAGETGWDAGDGAPGGAERVVVLGPVN